MQLSDYFSGEYDTSGFYVTKPPRFYDVFLKFKEAGKDRLQLVMDYDGTVTYELDENGQPRPSLVAVLRNGDYLNDEYSVAAHRLANYYRPIEKDPKLDENEKKRLMQEWWTSSLALLIKHQLRKSVVEGVVNDERLKVREGMKELFEVTAKAGVPLVILSAGLLGKTSIDGHLEKNGMLTENVIVVANEIIWDAEGKMVGYKKPVITSENKGEIAVNDPSVLEKVKGRTNVILVGDGLGDIRMAKGLPAEEVLNFGFLNDQVEELRNAFANAYDALIVGDKDAWSIVKVVKRVIG
jgi:cytosolic 5'-nucleotidase 3